MGERSDEQLLNDWRSFQTKIEVISCFRSVRICYWTGHEDLNCQNDESDSRWLRNSKSQPVCLRYTKHSNKANTILTTLCDAATRYTTDHEYVQFDDATNIGTVGITDYAQKALGDVVFVELPQVDSEVTQAGTHPSSRMYRVRERSADQRCVLARPYRRCRIRESCFGYLCTRFRCRHRDQRAT